MAVMPEGRQTVKNFQHNKMEFMPTVTRNDPDMFVRCHGEFSSSYKKYAKQATHLDHLDAAEEVLFQQRFAIDCNEVWRIFSSPA